MRARRRRGGGKRGCSDADTETRRTYVMWCSLLEKWIGMKERGGGIWNVSLLVLNTYYISISGAGSGSDFISSEVKVQRRKQKQKTQMGTRGKGSGQRDVNTAGGEGVSGRRCSPFTYEYDDCLRIPPSPSISLGYRHPRLIDPSASTRRDATRLVRSSILNLRHSSVFVKKKKKKNRSC